MAYSYARRRELAALKLRALGVDPGRRNPEKVWRETSEARRVEAITALGRQVPTYRGGGVFRPGRTLEHVRERVRGASAKRVPLRQSVPGLDADVTTSASPRSIRKALRDARDSGQRVVVYVTIDKGAGPRTRVIDGRGAQGDQLDQGAGAERGELSSDGGTDVVGKVQIVAAPGGSNVFGGRSVDPGDLLDYLDAYEDFWDAWADLADADYGEVR